VVGKNSDVVGAGSHRISRSTHLNPIKNHLRPEVETSNEAQQDKIFANFGLCEVTMIGMRDESKKSPKKTTTGRGIF
jgi:hypothetical protein